MTSRNSSIFHPLRDFIVISAILAGLNIALSGKDFGWLALNPTPWLLVPVLLGARYGLATGAACGFLTSCFIALMRSRADGITMSDCAQAHLYELSALSLMGFLAGQWHQLQSNRQAELELENNHMRDQLSAARAEVTLGMAARQDLQRKLALHNVELASLDDDLRSVLASPQGQFISSLLELLHHHCGVISAGMYQANRGELKLLGAIHQTAVLKDTLSLALTPLAGRALEERSIASVREPMSTTAEQPFLVALPWTDGSVEGVLLIHEMPLASLNWDNLSRLELILHWTFGLAKWRRKVGTMVAHYELLPIEEFMVMVAQALQVEQTHRVPSVVVRAEFTNDAEAKSPTLEKAILRALPDTSIATRTPNGKTLLVLIPFGGQAEGDVVGRELAKSGAQLRCMHYATTGTTDIQAFWARLLED